MQSASRGAGRRRAVRGKTSCSLLCKYGGKEGAGPPSYSARPPAAPQLRWRRGLHARSPWHSAGRVSAPIPGPSSEPDTMCASSVGQEPGAPSGTGPPAGPAGQTRRRISIKQGPHQQRGVVFKEAGGQENDLRGHCRQLLLT